MASNVLPVFQPKSGVKTLVEYEKLYLSSLEDPGSFWATIADEFVWKTRWSGAVCSGNFDVSIGTIAHSWFAGGQTNIAWNCIEANIDKGLGDQVAFIWEGNTPGEQGSMTYSELQGEVNRLANWLKSVGVGVGDCVVIYLPMLLQLPVAMLACARIGAVHSVVFAGFSAESLSQRILDSGSRVVLTCDAVLRGSKCIYLKAIVDAAFGLCKAQNFEVKRCLCIQNERLTDICVQLEPGRDEIWQSALSSVSSECETEWVDAETPLFMLYTSGSTGKPKGVVHCTGGYMVYAATTTKYVFDLSVGDIFWCTADCGWITGHTYLTYGPLLNGATSVIFEGVPNFPDHGRCWDIVDKYGVEVFYTAPTLLRSLQREGDEFVKQYSRKTLRLLGTVGEPINPEAWRWYHDIVGDGRCPIVDTWWQTETGGHLLTPLPGIFKQKPGCASLPFFGVEPVLLDTEGNILTGEAEGLLCFKRSWPSIMRTIHGDHARYETAYFAPFKGYYLSGDGARRDADGYYWITGRVDDVVNVSGHRIGSAEVESALVSDPNCTEAAVVGIDHDIKGQAIYAYVTLVHGVVGDDALKKELVNRVRSAIGPFASPDVIHWACGLPKTRSGKIMRRILRKIANNDLDNMGDISTLADPSVVESLIRTR
jgi:acetyl-CoA synthetase